MIYLDNAATTALFPSVKESIINSLDIFANPNSPHSLGHKMRQKIVSVQRVIASELQCKPEQVIFTSGGTEANNLAVVGFFNKKDNKRYRVATTEIEHKSLKNSILSLEKHGVEIFYLPNKNGLIIEDEIIPFLKKNQIDYLALSMVYNEIGIHFNTKVLSVIKKEIPNIYIHLDAVQGFLKYPINFSELNIDSISISAHKIHSLKGIGALIAKDKNRVAPILQGSSQYYGLRAGTENTLGILAFGASVEIWRDNKESFRANLKKLSKYLYQKYNEMFGDSEIIKILTPLESASDHILSLGVKNLFSEHIIHILEEREIYISAGSACNQKGDKPLFLNSFNIPKEFHNGVLRVSLSPLNSCEEIDIFLKALDEAIKELI
ncbi:aminotransferase class V-fold PLP-dependent enzyme [bacterium]|nr:aminotransferase class V-fold PLP-dependent enzyme [bacterium]